MPQVRGRSVFVDTALLCMVIGLTSPPAHAEIKGFPWSMGLSATSADSDGERFGFSFQQGVEWGVDKQGEWSLSPYVGISYDSSNVSTQSWNNVTKPRYGIELSNQFRFGPINWGEVRVGVQREDFYYHDGQTAYRETTRDEAYIRTYMNGNWAN